MNNAIIGTIAVGVAAAVVAAGVALGAEGFVVKPVRASVAVQQDGTCRGHLGYEITWSDAELAADVAPAVGEIEVRAPCQRLTNLASGATWETKAGKLTATVTGARTFVLQDDPDKDGPRVAGECDIEVTATVALDNAAGAKVFAPVPRTRTRPDAKCVALPALVAASCWVARGSWPPDVPFPDIPKCPTVQP